MLFKKKVLSLPLICALAVSTEIVCIHDTSLPIVNDPPRIVSNSRQSLVNDTLYYPDSTLCTLSVADLNDSILSVKSNTIPLLSRQVTFGLENKWLILSFERNTLARFNGSFAIVDQNGGLSDSVSLSVSRMLKDRVLSLYPPDLSYWKVYDGAVGAVDTYFVFNAVWGVRMRKPANSSGTSWNPIGLRSKFRLVGDFSFTVQYLGAGLSKSSALGLFVSPHLEQDPLGDGESGLKVCGNGSGNFLVSYGPNWAQSVVLDSLGQGTFLFTRTKNQLIVASRKTLVSSFTDTISTMITNDSLFIHMIRSADSSSSMQCFWTDFNLYEGRLIW